ncbi:hypothetical protein TNIN_46901 [Trichonephila inaurata madagascariensis]|uniref:Uncharacterized protein n=1 Tax=Trichonephila inaurata madagascariensis TaxID=2747483 RepID=A0A8X7BT04_9ARAC|nr:hypothetical protein TNIN_46901 [Trichonephila inaurata madagascariensis]
MLRPIQRVYPLEVQLTEPPDDPLNDCTFTNPTSSISSDMLSDPNDSSSVLARVSRHGQGSLESQGRNFQRGNKLDSFSPGYVYPSCLGNVYVRSASSFYFLPRGNETGKGVSEML